jgi:hypothetical protein
MALFRHFLDVSRTFALLCFASLCSALLGSTLRSTRCTTPHGLLFSEFSEFGLHRQITLVDGFKVGFSRFV